MRLDDEIERREILPGSGAWATAGFAPVLVDSWRVACADHASARNDEGMLAIDSMGEIIDCGRWQRLASQSCLPERQQRQ